MAGYVHRIGELIEIAESELLGLQEESASIITRDEEGRSFKVC